MTPISLIKPLRQCNLLYFKIPYIWNDNLCLAQAENTVNAELIHKRNQTFYLLVESFFPPSDVPVFPDKWVGVILSNFRADIVTCLSEVTRDDVLTDKAHRISEKCRAQLRVEVLRMVKYCPYKFPGFSCVCHVSMTLFCIKLSCVIWIFLLYSPILRFLLLLIWLHSVKSCFFVQIFKVCIDMVNAVLMQEIKLETINYNKVYCYLVGSTF